MVDNNSGEDYMVSLCIKDNNEKVQDFLIEQNW